MTNYAISSLNVKNLTGNNNLFSYILYCLSGTRYFPYESICVINTLVMICSKKIICNKVVCNFLLYIKNLHILITSLVDVCSKSGRLPCSRAVRTKCLRVVANIYSEESACLLYSQIY